jgi:hypothetical protein
VGDYRKGFRHGEPQAFEGAEMDQSNRYADLSLREDELIRGGGTFSSPIR